MKSFTQTLNLFLFGFLFLNFFCSDAEAFFVEGNVFERVEKKISLQIKESQVSVVVIEKIKNKTAVPQSFQYFFPLHTKTNTESVKFFVDGLSHPHPVFFGSEAREFLSHQATEYQDSRFYLLYKNFWQKLLTTDDITIPEKETITLKLQYNFNVDYLNDIFFGEIFVNDGTLTQNFEIDFVLHDIENASQFLLFSPQKEKRNALESEKKEIVSKNQKQVWHFSEKNFRPQNNLKFFFSSQPDAELRYSTEDETYFGDFINEPEKIQPKSIHLFIDQTGSMYPHWDKTTEVVSDFLALLPEETLVKIYFWDEIVRPFSPEFEPNTPFHQSQILGFMQAKKPIGKTNYEALNGFLFPVFPEDAPLSPPQEKSILTEADVSFFIGDFEKLKIPKNLDFSKKLKKPIFILDFKHNDFLELWSKGQNGRYLEIFSAPKFIKKEAFKNQFFHWYQIIDINHHSVKNKKFKTDFLPKKYILDSSPQDEFFVSRKFEPSTNFHQTASFLPHLWGQRQLAQILRQNFFGLNTLDTSSTPENSSLEISDSMRSIQKRFGVSLNLNDWKNSSFKQKLQILKDLEKIRFFDPQIKFQGDRPFYPETDSGEDFWVSYDFYDISNDSNTLSIKPFGETQRQLFLQYPDIFESTFGFGKSLKFCVKDFRCLVVSQHESDDFKQSDLLFWYGEELHHWGNESLTILLNKNIVQLGEKGSLAPNQKISRGAFSVWMVQYLWPELIQTAPDPGNIYFKDLKAEDQTKWAAIILAQKGIIEGYPDQTFRPNRPISRAEALKILLSAKGKLLKTDYQAVSNPPFDDISGWPEFWVLEAFKNGWVKGFAENKFKPHKTITRAEGAQLMTNIFPALINSH